MKPRETLQLTVILFAGLRLTLLVVLPADALFRYGDFEYYYRLATWSVAGQCPLGPGPCWPLLDYWYEFPPLFPYLSIGLLKLAGGGGVPPFHVYAYGLALIMLLADLGTFALVYHLAARLYGAERAVWLAGAYALMPAPLILSWWTFDALTTLWMLLALWALLTRRDALSAAAIGLGVITKFVPLLLLPAAWRARPPAQALAMALGAGGVALGVLAPFVWQAPQVAAASLRAQAAKASYATIWAAVDGNLQTADGLPITGNFGSLIEHFDLSRAAASLHNPSRIPGWLVLLAAGLVYGGIWLNTWRPGAAWDDRRTVMLFGFTWAVFLVWSKGWSPQWQQMLVPLILLIHPNRQGILLALALAGLSFLEWPLLISRGLAWVYWLTIPLRTLLFVGWAAVLGSWLLRPSREAAA